MRGITAAVAALTALAGVGLGIVPSRAAEIETFTAGHWQGAAFNADNGGFSHCTVYAGHDNGFLLGLSMGRGGAWAMDLVNEDWSLSPGASFAASIQVDGGPVLDVEGIAAASGHARMPLPDSDSLDYALRQGRALHVVAQGQRLSFTLAGSRRALEALKECVDRQSRATDTARGGAPEEGAVAFAVGVLRAMTDKEVDLLDRGSLEGPLARHAAVWRWEDVMGVLDVVPPGAAPDIGAVAKSLVAADRGNCNGTFDAGEIEAPADRGPPALRLFTACGNGNAAAGFYLAYQILALQDGSFFIVGHWSLKDGDSDGAAARTADADFRAALVRVHGGD